jgi:glycosyltransferase involved in cell wall biosynthesis
VIHPPVDSAFFTPGGPRQDYYVTVSRDVPYKRTDIVVGAFAAMPDRRLVVVGEGPGYSSLRSRATPNVDFCGYLAPEDLRERLRGARAFVFAAIEDFGIAPVEAMACGTPVIALRRGGAAETLAGLETGEPTGVFFEEQTAEAVVLAIRAFEHGASRITAQACRRRAESFSPERFRSEFAALVERRYAAWRAGFPG